MADAERAANADSWALARRLLSWAVRSYVVVLTVGLLLGLQVAPVASDLVTDGQRGTVAVITLSGAIDGDNANSVISRLQRARNDPDVEAVVLRVSSPGGGASASESIYLQVRRLAKRMPVVASVDAMAASGAYYAIAPADAIYAKPSSQVGSVGVYLTVPQSYNPLEGVIQSGPDKLRGADRRDWVYQTEAIKRAFLNAVMENRGNRIELSRRRLSYAQLYIGSRAVANGLADRIGGLESAIARAARLAEVSRPRVRVFGYASPVDFLTRANYVASNASEKRLVSPSTFVGSPEEAAAPNPVMLPPSVVGEAVADNSTGVIVNATAPS